MTDISVHSVQFLPENLTWDLTPDGAMAYVEGVTLDVTNGFVQATHYPNGFIPSGTCIAKNTSTGLYVAYVNAGANGTGTAIGILRASIQVVRPMDGSVKAKVGAPVMRAWGVVSLAALPFQSGAGVADSAAQGQLTHIHFAA